MKTGLYSLSLRLILLFIFSGISIILVLQYSMGLTLRQHFEKNIRPFMSQYVNYIHHEIGYPPEIKKAKLLSQSLPIDIMIDGNKLHWSSTTKFPDLKHFQLYDELNLDLQNKYLHPIDIHHPSPPPLYKITQGFYRDRFALISYAKGYRLIFILRGKLGQQNKNNGIFNALIGVLIILSLLYFLIRWLFLPIVTIQQGIKTISTGNLSTRIQLKRKDELGQLANAINTMADEIQQMLEAKRQLLLAISHELRSPITRSKISVALLPDSTQKENLNHDLTEMAQLISELLETERLKGKHQILNLTQVSLNHIIRTVIQKYFSNYLISLQLKNNLKKQTLDEARIRLLIKNLLDNALKYQASQNKNIIIKTQQQQNKIKLTIQDFGKGISEKHIPHLTDPFYRVDHSRQRKTGGYGLGLYLCHLITEAHHGKLKIISKPNKGTTIVCIFKNT